MDPRKPSGDESFVVLDWVARREADGVEVGRIARWDPWALPWGRDGVS